MFIFGLIEIAVAFMFFSSKGYGWAILQLFIAAFFFFLAIYARSNNNQNE
jgi:hypothetical protein